MARRLDSDLEMCELFFGDSDSEVEMEVADEEDEEEDSLDVDERIVVDEEDSIDENELADKYIADACEEDEADDVEIRNDREHHASDTWDTNSNNILEDIPASDEGDFDHEWCKNLRGFPLLPEFLATPGLKCVQNLPPLEDCKPIDLFKLFIDDEQIKQMKTQTNLYARQIVNKLKQSNTRTTGRSIVNTWKPVALHEIKNFLSIIAHMCVVKKPKLSDYWAKRSILQSTFASKVMKRDRFMNILAMFHLNDNSLAVAKGKPGYDPLHQVRPLVDHLNNAFQTVYTPEQNISIDDTMCPWRGRLSFKVYEKDKPIKWGIKLYELCESTSGYVCKFEIFCGMPGLSSRPYDVIQRLMEPLKSLGYCLYTDSYYTSVALAEDLASTNTGFTGIVMRNRVSLPRDFMQKTLSKGNVDFMRHKNTMVLRWTDNIDMSVLTTIHKPQMVMVKTCTGEKKKPIPIVEYNKYIGGVNHSDQMVSYNPFHRKTIKWWKKLAFHLLSLTMVQAHCLYLKVRKRVGKPGVSLEEFVLSVGESLVTCPANDEDAPTGSAVQQPLQTEMLRFQGKHYLALIKSRRYCHVCYARLKAEGKSREYCKNKTPRTKYECKTCKMSFCIDPCMEAYHSMQDYTKVKYPQ